MFELHGSRIDFPALRAQKLTLVRLAGQAKGEEQKHLDGLVAFLDYVQDQAAAKYGNRAVFGFKWEE